MVALVVPMPSNATSKRRKIAPPAGAVLRCGFCGLDQGQVDLLIRGLDSTCICSDCVRLARDIIGAKRLGLINDE